ncbi:NAD-binding protein [Prescottella defluvii]|nr:NAD-binding protein [Prescottella defluvii]
MAVNDFVLVPGAGGVGRVVVDKLRAHDMPVRVMVRHDDERANDVRALGAEVVIGDLTRRRPSRPRSTASGGCTSEWPCRPIICSRRPWWPPSRRSTESSTPW